MEQLRFDGRVAIVTGAGRGLGRAYAEHLAALGAKVVVNNRIRPDSGDPVPVAQTVADAITDAGGVAVADTSDISTGEGAAALVQTALDAFGAIHILVNNAGIVHFIKFRDYPEDEFDAMLNIQLRGTWRVTQAAWPHMIAQGYGRVVNTVSRGAFFGDAQGAAYATMKGATYGLTRALAVEGREHGILVNAISPTAWTPLYQRAPDVDQQRKEVLERDFLPDRVAPVVAMLAAESCPFTGEVIAAGGGQVSRLFMSQTPGHYFSGVPDADEVLEQLPAIWDESESYAMGLVTPGVRASGTPRAEVPDIVAAALANAAT